MKQYQKTVRAQIKFILLILRWTIILGGLGFTLYGWNATVIKFISGKTSFSITDVEMEEFTYPSITLCSGLDLTYVFMVSVWQTLEKKKSDKPKEMQKMFLNISFPRDDFMDSNNIAFYGLDEKNAWVETASNLYSGRCYTHDPPGKTKPRAKYGFHLRLKLPNQLKNDSDAKDIWLQNFKIFLHDRDKFFYYEDEDMPNHVKLDNSQIFVSGKTVRVTINLSKLIYLDTADRPCSSDSNYSFANCYEKAFAEIRGCQKPWLYFPELDIPKCDTLEEARLLIADDSHTLAWSFMDKRNASGCQRTCTNNIYELHYSSADDFYTLDYEDMFYALIYFEDFHFQYEQEYLTCDWTCLIGEIGGNFGFFLGGSIITLYDIVYFRLLRVLK